MKTLLDLFFKPYLKFLLKYNLVAFAAFFVIVLSGIQEVISIAPFLYFFGMYSTNNRHQFKDNISWMMASFSKKTLLGYQLLSQTMILLLQVTLVVVVGVGFIASVIYFIPESSQVMPKAISILSAPEVQDSLIDNKSSYFSRKEVLVSFIAFIFFLITMYSPISMKDYLKSIEQKNAKHKHLPQYIFIGIFTLTFFLIGSDVDLKEYLLLLLSAIVIGELVYLGYIYNKVFILLHPRQIPKAAGLAVMAFFAFSYFNYSQSLHYFQTGKSQEGRLKELMFLGVLAPKLDSHYFDVEFSTLENPKLLVQFLRNKRYKTMISEELISQHLMKADDFSVVIDLLKALPSQKEALLSQAEVWSHLNTLFLKLHKKNKASAFWSRRDFHKELSVSNWKPDSQKAFSELNELEQMETLAWYEKNDTKQYGVLLSQAMSPLVEEMHSGKKRSPASSDL